MKKTIRTFLIAIILFVVGTTADVVFDWGILTKRAAARVGRPATPISVAGVARRTTRRAIRRTAVYVNTLPVGCTTVVIDGVRLHHCGTTYYQASGGRYCVVEVH
jgi:hypothetical protein